MPIGYTRSGPFDHDLAVTTPAVPVLEPIDALTDAAPGSDRYHFLQTRLIRERNKVVHALSEAVDVVDAALGKLG